MQMQEKLIVPGLGVVILLAAFTLGASMVYTVLLVLLGLAAAGTYFAPPRVQVETRTGIAALGVVILVVYFSSTGFWLALLSFVAIGALQVRHRSALGKELATAAWLNALLAKRRAAAGQAGGEEGGEASSTPALLGSLQGLVTPASIGGALMGVVALLSASMPWVLVVISFAGESQGIGFSGTEAARTIREDAGGGAVVTVILIVGAALALASIASFILPRVVPILVGIAGMLLTVGAYVYLFGKFGEGSGGNVVTIPHIGFFVTGGAFMMVLLLHIIPAAYRSRR